MLAGDSEQQLRIGSNLHSLHSRQQTADMTPTSPPPLIDDAISEDMAQSGRNEATGRFGDPAVDRNPTEPSARGGGRKEPPVSTSIGAQSPSTSPTELLHQIQEAMAAERAKMFKSQVRPASFRAMDPDRQMPWVLLEHEIEKIKRAQPNSSLAYIGATHQFTASLDTWGQPTSYVPLSFGCLSFRW